MSEFKNVAAKPQAVSIPVVVPDLILDVERAEKKRLYQTREAVSIRGKDEHECGAGKWEERKKG